MEYFNNLCIKTTNDARYTREIKCRISVGKEHSTRIRVLPASWIKLTKNLLKRYIWSIALCFSEMWILRKADQIYFKCLDMWRWKRMEKISWTDHVRNEDFYKESKKRNCLQTIKRKKPKWIDHVLRRNCLQNHFVEGKIEGRIEVTERQGKRRKQLLDDFKVTIRYCDLKEEARN